MKVQLIVILLGIVGIATGLSQIGDEQISIIVTSEGKAKISQSLFPKTFVSTIDVQIISEKVSKLLAIDEKNILLGTTQNKDLLKIATLGASAVDLKYDADILTYESGVFRLKYNSELESKIKLPPLSKLVSLNTIPLDISDEMYILPPGDISLSFTIRPVTSQEFFVPVGDLEYKVEAITAAKIEGFSTNPDEIQFIIKDKAIVLTIIPKEVMDNPDDALLNGEKVEFSQFHQNSTHSWIRIVPHEKGLVKIIDTGENSEEGGCLIATAAFGSEMAPQVQNLREIRDNQLMKSNLGASFMSGFNQLYYSFSPHIADYERENPVFKEMVKIGITPMLFSLSVMEFAESENEILGLGISVILMNVGMYFVLPFIICYESMRCIRTRGVWESNWGVIFSHSVLSAVKKSLFGIVALLVLSVSVSSAFESAYADEGDPIRMVLDLTRGNLEDSLDTVDDIPSTAQTFYDMGNSEYEKANEALANGDFETAEEHALIAMALFEDSASVIGELDESIVLDQLPPGFGAAVGSGAESEGQGLGVGGIPPGIINQLSASNIFEIQEGITGIDEEVGGLRELIESNGLDVNLDAYDESVNLAKEVLANGDIPNAQAKLALANEIKDNLYEQINTAVEDSQDERVQEFADERIEDIESILEKGENLGLTQKTIDELQDTLEVLQSGEFDEIIEKTGDDSEFVKEVEGNEDVTKEFATSSGNSENAPGQSNDDSGPGNSENAPGQNKGDDGFEDSGFDSPGNSGNAPGQNKGDDGFEDSGFEDSGFEDSGFEDSGFDSFENVGLDSLASSPDDFYENSFESSIDDVFEVNFDGTKKGKGNGKGNLGESASKTDAPGNSENAPGQLKKNDGGNGNNNLSETICHKGNTITISISSIETHLVKHGDTRGACGLADNIPVITLTGSSIVNIDKDDTYVDAGATASDPQDGDISISITTTGLPIVTSSGGSFTVTYDVTDSDGNDAVQVNRIVSVADGELPVITILGDNPVCMVKSGPYSDRLATVTDFEDVTITDIIISGNTFAEIDAGMKDNVFTRIYSVTDSDGNTVTKDLVINVQNNNNQKGCNDSTAPAITLNGADNINIVKDVGTYVEAGAIADDGSPVIISGITDPDETANVGTIFTIDYDAIDLVGNDATTVSRTVTIVATDTEKPVITLVNPTLTLNLVANIDAYSEQGGSVTDNDPDYSEVVTPTGTVDTTTVGQYTVTYTAPDDAANNAPDPVIRTVNVTLDTEKPVITLVNPTLTLDLVVDVGTYTEQGGSVTDNDPDYSEVVTPTGTVDTTTVGQYTVTYTAPDDAANNAPDPVIRTVNVNSAVIGNPPTVSNTIPSFTISKNAPTNTLDLRLVFTDTLTDDDDLEYSIVSNDNSDLLPGVVAGIIGGDGWTLTLDYADSKDGVANITVSAKDIDNNTINTSFTITVSVGECTDTTAVVGDKASGNSNKFFDSVGDCTVIGDDYSIGNKWNVQNHVRIGDDFSAGGGTNNADDIFAGAIIGNNVNAGTADVLAGVIIPNGITL